MKTQLIIRSADSEPIVIDVVDDESVQVHLDTHPNRFMPEPLGPTIRIDGLRWRDDKHHHLGWRTWQLRLGESITVDYVQGETPPTRLQKEDEYVEPEKTCSFCDKRASEVELLVERNLMSRICNECVVVCQAEIDKQRQAREK